MLLASRLIVLLLTLAPPSPSDGAETNLTHLGPLVKQGHWVGSGKKGQESPASPTVATPGLSGSTRAAWFRLARYDDPGNTSAEITFAPLSGEKIVVELTVKPSSELRNLGVAVRGGKDASAYVRFNGRRVGWCQQYGPTNAYHDIAPFEVGAENRLRIQLNTRTATMKAWINGAGGTEWPFRSVVPTVDRVDLFMSHGNGPEVFALVDDLVVRDDKNNAVLREGFEGYYTGALRRDSSSKREAVAP